MEDRMSADLEEGNTPKKDKAMVEQMIGKGGKSKDNWSSEKSGETEECKQQDQTRQGAA